MNIEKLKKQKAAMLKEAERINEALSSNDYDGDRQADEDRADGLIAAAKNINQQIDEFSGTGRRRTSATAPAGEFGSRVKSLIQSGKALRVSDFKAMDAEQLDDAGFDSLFDFAQSVYKQRHGNQADHRLIEYSASQKGSNDPTGGFLVPTRFAQEILTSDKATEPWLEMIDRTILPPGFGKVSLPAIADRDRSGKTVGGMRLKRRDEGATVAESTITLTREELPLESAGTIVKVSQELLEDSIPGSVDEMLREVFAEALTQTLSLDVIGNNTGNITQGIINSNATYTVAKEGGQAADTINGTNILKMRERMKPSSLNRAVWLVASDVYRQLVSSHSTLTNDDYPLFIHGNGVDVPDTLLGRPVYQTEACSTLGDLGDIIFADLSKYRHIMRGPMIDSSPHIGFETNEIFYKFMIRDFGRPKYNATYKTLQNFEVAEFVTLAERA